MSQYLNFFIVKNEQPIEFLSFSRNTTMYEAFDDFSKWECPTLLSEEILRDVRDYLKKENEQILNMKKRRESIKSDILSHSTDVKNIVETLESLYEDLDCLEEEIEDIVFCEKIVDTLVIIKRDMDEKTDIFFGVETSEEDFKEYFNKLE